MTTRTPAWLDEAPAAPRPTRSVVTEDEAHEAAALLTDWRRAAGVQLGQLSASQLGQLRAMVAGALADAREGATIPGQRHDVGQNLDVSLRALPAPPEREAELARLELRLRAQWAHALQSSGLQPLGAGWPPITRTWMRWPWDYSGGQQPEHECSEAEAELVRLSIHGLAVQA